MLGAWVADKGGIDGSCIILQLHCTRLPPKLDLVLTSPSCAFSHSSSNPTRRTGSCDSTTMFGFVADALT